MDIVTLLMEMRSGRVATDINDKFQDVLRGVLETGGKGELTVKLLIKPSKMGMGGAVIEVETEHEVKTKRPELKIGRSMFFVNKDGQLTRDDPDQAGMFAGEPEPSTKKESK